MVDLRSIDERVYRVTGWTYFEDEQYVCLSDSYHSEADPNALDMDAVRNAIVREMKEKGYKFTGIYHQYGDYGTPIINNKYIVRYSQRSWGDIMADVLDVPDEDGFAYMEWAWMLPEGEQYVIPSEDREIY